MWSNAADKHFKKLESVENRADAVLHGFCSDVCEIWQTVEAPSHVSNTLQDALSSYQGMSEELIRNNLRMNQSLITSS